MVTLWELKDGPAIQFNKNNNVGLHHVAFQVQTEDALIKLHKALVNGEIKVEFSPEILGKGPAKHMMCYEPSGIRVEFI